MVNEARSLLPTDILALVVHAGLSYENAAWPRERLGAGDGQPALSIVRDQLLAFARRRSAWVKVRRQRLQGLVGARQRGGSEAWEIDYLIDATKDHSAAIDLLECAIAEAGKDGAHKLFLRLAAGSDLLPPALETGFIAYQEETLFGLSGRLAAEPLPLRPASTSDSYPLFRLYCSATPEAIRRCEAATFVEWHAAQERRWLRNGQQFVLEREGVIHASVRAARLPHGFMLDLLIDDEASRAVGGIVAGALSGDEPEAQVFVLVPRTAEALARGLEDVGFRPRGDFVSLVRRTARPLAMPKKVAVVAENAVGV